MSENRHDKLSLYLVTISLVVSIVLAGSFSYFYIQTQSQLVSLQERLESQQSRLELLRTGSNQETDAPQVYALVERSVIQIVTKKAGRIGLEPFATGSGFVYDLDGHVITNNHVIESADTIEVTFLDGTTVRASVAGTDPYSDMAVLNVRASREMLKPVILGNSSSLRVGETVYALGAPFGLSWSIAQGIVSQIGRMLPVSGGYSIPGVIQVDAAINPGNSGGPLLDSLGEVVGVNTAIQSETGVFSGVGFAIPSNLVKKVAPSLIRTGRYEHPWLGAGGMDVTPSIAEKMNLPEARGVLVSSVVKNGPADKAGIRGGNRTEIIDGINMSIGGDVITHMDGIVIRKFQDLLVYLEYSKRPGERTILTIIREGKVVTLDVTLGVRPPLSSR
jgi:S1-C subfamily serine protease